MFGFSPKLPIAEQDRVWVNEGFNRLERLLGRRRMLEARVITPTAEDFPDPYNKTNDAAEKLFCRVCDYMDVDRGEIEFEIFPDETEELKDILPSWRDNPENVLPASTYMRWRTEAPRVVMVERNRA